MKHLRGRGVNKTQGLTLIELMIVVAIIAILATVGYPLYTNQADKARRSDAMSALQSLAVAQERFYTANGGYAANLGSLPLDSFHDGLESGQSEKGYYVVATSISVDAQGYSLTATPVVNGAQHDDKCGIFTLNNTGARSTESNDCW